MNSTGTLFDETVCNTNWFVKISNVVVNPLMPMDMRGLMDAFFQHLIEPNPSRVDLSYVQQCWSKLTKTVENVFQVFIIIFLPLDKVYDHRQIDRTYCHNF